MNAHDVVSLFRIFLLVACCVLAWDAYPTRNGYGRAFAVMVSGLFAVLAVGAGVRQWAVGWADLYLSALYTPYLGAMTVLLLAMWLARDHKGRKA